MMGNVVVDGLGNSFHNVCEGETLALGNEGPIIGAELQSRWMI